MSVIYKNSRRTHRHIRNTFFELLKEKPLDKISVTDIARRAELSRNTFYAHYSDVDAIIEEFQREFMDDMERIMVEGVELDGFYNPLPILQKMVNCVHAREEEHRLLLSMRTPTAFIQNMKNRHIEMVMASPHSQHVRDKKGMRIFLEIILSGFLGLVLQYLRGETDLSLPEIAEEANRVYLGAIQIYR